jgi:hypothetical protein
LDTPNLPDRYRPVADSFFADFPSKKFFSDVSAYFQLDIEFLFGLNI